MTTDHHLSLHESAAFHDAAKAHARVLRREAIDVFWAAIAGRIRQVLQAARAAVTGDARRPHHHRHGRA